MTERGIIKQIKLLSLFIVILITVGCSHQGFYPEKNKYVSTTYLETCDKIESGECIITKDEYDNLQTGIRYVVEFYGRIDSDELDIKSTKPNSVSVCKGCNYFMYCDTHSMSPTFTCNDSLFGYKPDKEELVVGDIVGYQDPNENRVFIHRIIGIENETYIMKGDNNLQADPYHPTFEDIRFKIVKIEYK